MKLKHLFLLLAVVCVTASFAKGRNSFVGKQFAFVYSDTIFHNPYIDIDEWRPSPEPHRYIHGGFSDGTRFSFYFPTKKSYRGHFFQYATPFPDKETVAQSGEGCYSMIGFSVANGAYFVETNEGGSMDFTNPGKQRAADIGAYRANAACAEFSRVVAQKIYGCERPYGYIFGGSGGAYRTAGAIEQTKDVWQGAVPFVMGSPQAIPNVFAVRMNCMRVLRNKLPQIVDAMDAGGSGDPYRGLNQEEYQALKEATAMGFPLQAWYAWDKMGVHGFRVLYQSVVQMDPTYFNHDFWQTEGYLGANPTLSLINDHVSQRTVITRLIDYDEGAKLGVAEPLSDTDRGSADKAWATMGTGTNKPAAYELAYSVPDVGFNGGDLVILSGEAKGAKIQLMEARGHAVGLAPTNPDELLAKVRPGDSVLIDNGNFLACQTYYRHQVPSLDYYAWNQFRDMNGQPIYPQRPMLLGPLFTRGAAGCVPDGNIQGKVILLGSSMDSESFPWQCDWYRSRVKSHLGTNADDNFRLWYTDHGVHGDGNGILMDASRTISYMGILQQALLDLSDWCEKGIAPAATTGYTIEQGAQVVLAETAEERHGIQPIPVATICGAKKATVRVGEKVSIHVVADVPQGYGRVVEAKWTFGKDGKPDNVHPDKLFSYTSDLTKATYSNDGSRVEFSVEVVYDKPGTYFPAVRVVSERNPDGGSKYTRIENIDRVRIVVE